MYKLLCVFFLVFFAGISFGQDDEMKKDIPQEEADTIDIEDIDFDEIDLEDIEEDELSKPSDFPWQKFAVGGQLGNLQFGNVTNVGVSPEVVYSLSDKIKVGGSGVLEITRINRFWNGFQFVDANFRSDNIGGRAFTRIQPVQAFPVFAQIEYEALSQENPYDRIQNNNGGIDFLSVKQNVNNVNAGLGFNNGPYYLALMYNFMNVQNREDFFDAANQDLRDKELIGPNQEVDFDNRVYPQNAVTFRGGLLIPLGQGNKNKKRKKNKKKKDREEKPTREN